MMCKFLLLILIAININLNVYSQKHEHTKIELPLLSIKDQRVDTILNNVISFSIKCQKEELKYLFFDVNIIETDIGVYRITITLIDKEDLDFRLKSDDIRNKPFGYLCLNNRIFIFSGINSLRNLFDYTDSKRNFESYTSVNYLRKSDYSTWIYSYQFDKKIELINFYPLCP